jgi:hypothetical protein
VARNAVSHDGVSDCTGRALVLIRAGLAATFDVFGRIFDGRWRAVG